MTLDSASRIAIAAMAFVAVASSWYATLALPAIA
jgi:hypothetical protein